MLSRRAKQELRKNGLRVPGKVDSTYTCWWLRVNQKAVRIGLTDTAKYPHIIRYTYTIGDETYTKSAYFNWNERCPDPGETVTVCYRADCPKKAVIL